MVLHKPTRRSIHPAAHTDKEVIIMSGGFKCSICGVSFQSLMGLPIHGQTVHGGSVTLVTFCVR